MYWQLGEGGKGQAPEGPLPMVHSAPIGGYLNLSRLREGDRILLLGRVTALSIIFL